MTGCFGKKVLLEPTPMRVAGREPTRHAVTGVIRIKAAPSGNGTGPKPVLGEKTQPDAPAGENGAEAHPEAMASG